MMMMDIPYANTFRTTHSPTRIRERRSLTIDEEEAKSMLNDTGSGNGNGNDSDSRFEQDIRNA